MYIPKRRRQIPMKVDYNVTGKDRKSLVNVIATLTGKKAEYLGMPTASYKVGCFTVDRNGTLEFDDRADSKGTEDLIKELDKRGFTAKVGETSGEESETADGAEQGENMGLTISVPLAAVSTCSRRKVRLSRRRLELTTCRLKSVRIKFHSHGFRKCRDRMHPKHTPISLPLSANSRKTRNG
jgi:hypothetical protein